MTRIKALIERDWDVSEQEPTWAEVIGAGAVFVLFLLVVSTYIWLLAPAS